VVTTRQEIHRSSGFTLIELLVVVAGLGILSSLAVPNVMKIFDFNNIDEAKSLLNYVAADCLQNARLNGGTAINPDIIDNKKLKPIGYEIDSASNTCRYFQLQPLNPSDDVRYHIGFSTLNGKLTKHSYNTRGGPDVQNSCEKWAGTNCKLDEQLKILIEHIAAIGEAKKICSDNYSQWLNGGTTPSRFQRWDPVADSECPARPNDTYKSSGKCTTNGCTKTVYGLDGKFVGFEEDDYTDALDEKYGKICTEKTKAKKDISYTNPNSSSISITECGDMKFWYYKGENVGDQKAWEILNYKDNNPTGKQTLFDGTELYLCMGEEKPTEELMTQCINENEEAGCDNQINEKISEKFNGEFVPKSGSPGSCSSVNWMCEGKNYKTDKSAYDAECTVNCDMKIPHRVCNSKGNYSKPLCSDWAKCNGLI
jgi:prepilin-type N-terminal cleavage/methylation domain-containing protein